MQHLTRRAFVSGAAALGVAAGGAGSAQGQLVWKTGDWSLARFRALVKDPARVKQVYDIVKVNDGIFLNNVKNSLNGLEFGFGVPRSQIKVVVAMHGPANMLNYDDFIWNKYQLGEMIKVNDPETGKPAVRNIFVGKDLAAAPGAESQNPDDEDSMYQARNMATLRHRGVQFLSCHTATEEQVRVLVRLRKLSTSPGEIVKEMLAHTVEGTLVVASMVAAIALLQTDGRFTYITAA